MTWSASLNGIKGTPSYSWTFSGGSPSPTSSSNTNPTVRYASAGSSTTSLTVRGRGQSRAQCSRTFTVSAAADTQVPTTPTNLAATAASASQINLSWTASTDNVSVTGYRVERCQGLSCTNFLQIATPTGTTYNDTTGLTASTTYRYRVRATDAAGNLSAYSNIASATTSQQTGDTTPPTVLISSPASGTTYTSTSAQTVTITASASDTVGVTRVEFYDGGTLQGTDSNSPYSFGWAITSANNGTHSWTARAYDAAGNNTASSAVSLTVNIAGLAPSGASINSTSQNCGPNPLPACSSTTVSQQPTPAADNSRTPASGTGLTGYQIMAVNDLGMHCGDLDTRVASILPPFNVLNVRVIKKPTTSGGTTTRLTDADVEVYYSAASNPNDPILSTTTPAEYLAPAGSRYKTNFWDIARTAYDPFYPVGVLLLFYPGTLNIVDVGLPVPNLQKYYLDANGALLPIAQQGATTELDQQGMPAITTFTTSTTATPQFQPTALASSPYTANQPQKIKLFVNNWPFFANFAFGYIATGLNWFTAEGIPIATYDDAGRVNSYPLLRVQAKAAAGNALGVVAGTVLATVDTVVPVSAEADCKGCHDDPADPRYAPTNSTVANNIANKIGITNVVDSSQDPQFGTVPTAVSIEWATDKNILRLHDYNEGSKYPTACDLATNPTTTNANCLINKAPVVCQTCHYTPALDLLQLGPNNVNGRQQGNNQSMSRVMHNFHGLRNAAGTAVSTSGSDLLFPYMPASNNRTVAQKDTILTQTCYQCHPGKNTKCMRGAMANGALVCQDCHGQMTQVGNDFSKNMPGGSFILASDFYTNASTPRVPWANEPGCGSCHTGDAVSNMSTTAGVIANPTDTFGNADNLRLRQAYITSGNCSGTTSPANCPKVTPIVPTTSASRRTSSTRRLRPRRGPIRSSIGSAPAARPRAAARSATATTACSARPATGRPTPSGRTVPMRTPTTT